MEPQKNYPTIYEPSFVFFWGMALAGGLLAGGSLLFALIALMILVLHSHEYAHAKKAISLNVAVQKVVFTWLGGAIICDSKSPQDTIKICNAGLIDTFLWWISFMALRMIVYQVGAITGWNFADSSPLGLLYWMRMLNGIILFTAIAVISNMLPIEYNHKTHGLITTDGWANIVLSRVDPQKETRAQPVNMSP